MASAVVILTAAACSTRDEVLAIEDMVDAASPTVLPEASTSHDAGDAGATDGSAPKSTCPGTVIPLTTGASEQRVGSVTGDTSANGVLSQDSPTCGGGNGKDVVYAITSDVQGQAHVKLDAAFDALLYVRTACDSPTTELQCKTVPVGGGKTEISFPMMKNQTAWVVVDGVAGTSGTFTLDVAIGATKCGDGVAQYPEQCDDGNTSAGDGCSSACQLETPLAGAGKCPGATYNLAGPTSPLATAKVSFAGDVSQLASTAGAFGCGGGSGADQVYAITPATSGALTVELHASFPDSLLHARGECFTSASELDCREGPIASVPTRMTFPVVAQKTYFVFVDSDKTPASGSGLYTLDVTLAGATCGDGVLQSPEQCDDGNQAIGDGCAADCTLEPAPAGIDTCPGAAITLAPGATPSDPMTYRTTASTALLTSGVKSCVGQADRKDAVYTFVAPYDGWLTAKAAADFNVVVDLRTNCVLESVSSSAGSVACGSSDQGDGTERLEGPVAAGTTYYVVIDGGFSNTNKEGVFTLDMSLRPSVCGNGVIEGGEQCDDGATSNGDGCDATCKLEPTPTSRTTCANAEALALTETTPGSFRATAAGGNWNLPGGGYFSAPCAGAGKEAYFTVTPPIDGVIVAKVDASYNVSIGARSSCPPNTGGGFLACSNKSSGPGGEAFAFAATAGTKYWIIVDAPGAKDLGSFSLDVTLQSASCGDGLAGGVEECDDGNLAPGDGCSPTCTLEPMTDTDTCPGHAVALTGAGATTTRTKVISLSTTSLTSSYGGTCGGTGRDGVVAVTSDIAGTMTAQLTASWATTLYARTSCADASSELGCKAYDPAKPSETTREITLPVQPGIPTYFFVDGIGSASGAATLNLTVTP